MKRLAIYVPQGATGKINQYGVKRLGHGLAEVTNCLGHVGYLKRLKDGWIWCGCLGQHATGAVGRMRDALDAMIAAYFKAMSVA